MTEGLTSEYNVQARFGGVCMHLPSVTCDNCSDTNIDPYPYKYVPSYVGGTIWNECTHCFCGEEKINDKLHKVCHKCKEAVLIKP